MERYIGLDVHCKESVYVVQDGEGGVVKEGAVETTEEGLKAMVEEVGAPGGTKGIEKTKSRTNPSSPLLGHPAGRSGRFPALPFG
jgi:hypothetical protein